MLKEIFQMLHKVQDGIGNDCRVSVQSDFNGVKYKVYWPDGYILQFKIDDIEIMQSNLMDDDSFIDWFIAKCKAAHPTLAKIT